jgi:hypothetical protein
MRALIAGFVLLFSMSCAAVAQTPAEELPVPPPVAPAAESEANKPNDEKSVLVPPELAAPPQLNQPSNRPATPQSTPQSTPQATPPAEAANQPRRLAAPAAPNLGGAEFGAAGRPRPQFADPQAAPHPLAAPPLPGDRPGLPQLLPQLLEQHVLPRLEAHLPPPPGGLPPRGPLARGPVVRGPVAGALAPVRVKDREKVHPGGVLTTVEVHAPHNPKREAIGLASPQYVEVVVPPFPPREVKHNRDGSEVKLDFGDYEVKVHFRRDGRIEVDYDD